MRIASVLLPVCLGLACQSVDGSSGKPDTEASSRTAQSSAQSEAERLKAEVASFPMLWDERAGFETKIIGDGPKEGPAQQPPADAPFELITYSSPVGELAAYLGKDPGDGQRHPAIIWLTGGDNNSIGPVWGPVDPSNDQAATAYREQGIVMMFPSQRGGNDNPGRREGFFGEVDDVIAARAHLATIPWVDPERIYLGGHSTGGTLAMLVAENSDQFRATFAFGPVGGPLEYGGDFLYCDPSDKKEIALRSPVVWMSSVRTPTFVFEGGSGNTESVAKMDAVNSNPLLSFYILTELNHFSVLAPVNALIAPKLLADTGSSCTVAFTDDELRAAMAR